MSNKKIIKELFDEEFDRNKMKEEILSKYEEKKGMRFIKIMKPIMVPICLILIALMGLTISSRENVLEEDIGIIKVYAYSRAEGEKVERKELKDNIKLGLEKYNLAMSSVPGYPIMFELDNIDYIDIDVLNGKILDWNRESSLVKEIGGHYRLSSQGTLYFNVNPNTNIKITGIKDKKKVFEKKITISRDDQFNYYAMLK